MIPISKVRALLEECRIAGWDEDGVAEAISPEVINRVCSILELLDVRQGSDWCLVPLMDNSVGIDWFNEYACLMLRFNHDLSVEFYYRQQEVSAVRKLLGKELSPKQVADEIHGAV